MQAAGDHQMQHEPQAAVETDGDLLAQPPDFADGLAGGCANRWSGRSQQERRLDYCPDELMSGDARPNRFHINTYVGQFWHESSVLDLS